ncbi:hypothetical protein H8Q88_18790 [Vibrio metschnikovii]|uniref:GIY-YIG domain-containing protein n=1 Tax=Vibrio metschnikovii TaxID=28172 RepID=A0A9X0UPE5_VIBME|nr:hypothetical protein [Vibrio metschnikovii]MBC5852933.1 hypothetical protein [Vibrio metschnikovii]
MREVGSRVSGYLIGRYKSKEVSVQIHIDWSGSYTLDELKGLTSSSDYGIYQIYGTHPVYGSDVLLYIGKADYQTLGVRIPQHDKWAYTSDVNNIRVYIGRLGSNLQVSESEWSKLIDLAERLLIYTHKPAYNSSCLNSVDKVPIIVHVFNWGNYRSLLPEVSAFRYLATDEEHFPTYKNFDLNDL